MTAFTANCTSDGEAGTPLPPADAATLEIANDSQVNIASAFDRALATALEEDPNGTPKLSESEPTAEKITYTIEATATQAKLVYSGTEAIKGLESGDAIVGLNGNITVDSSGNATYNLNMSASFNNYSDIMGQTLDSTGITYTFKGSKTSTSFSMYGTITGTATVTDTINSTQDTVTYNMSYSMNMNSTSQTFSLTGSITVNGTAYSIHEIETIAI